MGGGVHTRIWGKGDREEAGAKHQYLRCPQSHNLNQEFSLTAALGKACEENVELRPEQN